MICILSMEGQDLKGLNKIAQLLIFWTDGPSKAFSSPFYFYKLNYVIDFMTASQS